MTDHDEAAKIERAEATREIANTARSMFNAFLAEGFAETQALKLVASWLHGTSGGTHS